MSSPTTSLQAAAERWPRLYVALLHARHRNRAYRSRIVSRSTDITIEGFPRSGTSFANRAFSVAQPGAVRIATHAHTGAQVRRATALAIPTLVVVRHPADCIPSHYALREELRRTDPARPALNVAAALVRYVRFHRDVLKVQESVLLVSFEEVIRDYGLVIDRLNRRFGCEFARFAHTESNVAALFRTEGSHLSPSPDRDLDKARGVDLYCSAPEHLRLRAESVYHRVRVVVDEHARDTA